MVLKAFFGVPWRAGVAWFGSRKLDVLCVLWPCQCTRFRQGQPASGGTCFKMVVTSGGKKAQASHLRVWPSL